MTQDQVKEEAGKKEISPCGQLQGGFGVKKTTAI